MAEKNMIWKTDKDPEKIGEYEIARNIEVRDNGDGCIEVRVTQKTLLTDAVSLPKLLSPIEAIRMGAALVDAALLYTKEH